MVTSGLVLSNRYLLGKEIAAGGMGAVFEATDLRTGGQVAVKVLHPLYGRNPEFIARLRREAQIAASIRTRSAVKVMDLDEHEGTHYLVMEYVAGETLGDILAREGRLPAHEALNVCIEITRALEGAQAVGVVHRDLKPQNVKITDEGEVKVLDFGIARAEHLPGITGTNMFTGTPEYCAPERIDGQGDIRSDIYSLGIMLYELLAGQRPFNAPTAFGVLRQHEIAPVPPLPVQVPPEVQEVLDRTLAKKPEQRYRTPSELMTALRTARDAAARADGGGRPAVATVIRPAGAGPTEAPAPLVDPPGVRTITRAPGAAAATATDERTGPNPRTLGIIGAAVLALVLAGGAAFAFTRGGSSDGQSPTAGGARATPPAAVGARAPAAPTESAARPLLAPAEKVTLNASDERFLPVCQGPDNNPRVKTVLRITGIERSAESRRVSVSYVTGVPAAPGVDPNSCKLIYQKDADTRFIALQTTQRNGRVVASPSAGGTGVGANGAPEIYGQELSGVWVFEDVELDGTDLTLVQQEKATGLVLHTIKLLPR